VVGEIKEDDADDDDEEGNTITPHPNTFNTYISI
jgi:hypothetical protein